MSPMGVRVYSVGPTKRDGKFFLSFPSLQDFLTCLGSLLIWIQEDHDAFGLARI